VATSSVSPVMNKWLPVFRVAPLYVRYGGGLAGGGLAGGGGLGGGGDFVGGGGATQVVYAASEANLYRTSL